MNTAAGCAKGALPDVRVGPDPGRIGHAVPDQLPSVQEDAACPDDGSPSAFDTSANERCICMAWHAEVVAHHLVYRAKGGTASPCSPWRRVY